MGSSSLAEHVQQCFMQFWHSGNLKTWGGRKDPPKKLKQKPSHAVGVRFPCWETKVG